MSSFHSPARAKYLGDLGTLLVAAGEDAGTEQLLEAAATDGERAEAYYYVARKAMLDGEHHHDKVIDALAKCVALDREHSLLESYFAQVLLLGR